MLKDFLELHGVTWRALIQHLYWVNMWFLGLHGVERLLMGVDWLKTAFGVERRKLKGGDWLKTAVYPYLWLFGWWVWRYE